MTYLLDSSIIADLASPNPSPNVMSWLDAQSEETVFISVVTLAEIAEQIEMEQSNSQKDSLLSWLNNDLIIRFGGRISEITVAVSLKWGEIVARCKALGKSLSLSDSLSLAIALTNDHILVTRHTDLFADTGVKTISPFELQ
jgi:Predicted nucleic acid-binding protein, contains PIN domain